MKNTVNMAVIGLGQRGYDLMKNVLVYLDKLNISAICDLHEDRVDAAYDLLHKEKGTKPFKTTDYTALLTRNDVDAVFIASDWDTHIPLAIECMKNNKAVAMEVGGAYQIEDCWELIETQETTKTPFMLMENCCYGRKELLISNMAKKGLFGEIVHCSGAYGHDLREEIATGQSIRHYRQRNYRLRNCENYPTHELGPIAKVLNINSGNRMLTLTSTASKAAGMRDYILSGKPADKNLDPYGFSQGDIVITNIICADGSTIMLKLDTTLPRSYGREFTVRGTKGGYDGISDSVFLDGHFDEFVTKYGNTAKYEEHLPELWKEYQKNTIGGHDGMDYLIFNDFIDCLLTNKPMPIDVYDAAAWMCISCLSEQSIALGSAPVAIPDFTRGKWIK